LAQVLTWKAGHDDLTVGRQSRKIDDIGFQRRPRNSRSQHRSRWAPNLAEHHRFMASLGHAQLKASDPREQSHNLHFQFFPVAHCGPTNISLRSHIVHARERRMATISEQNLGRR